MNLPTVTVREFARIVGVDHSAVSRAAKVGKRLTSKSVVRDTDGNPRIIVLTGCYEWIQNKDYRKDSRSRVDATSSFKGIMSRDAAVEVDRHYSALMKQLEYDKACEQLMPVAKFDLHASECLKTCRDTFVNLPLVLSELARPQILRLARTEDEIISPELQKKMDDAIVQLRMVARREVQKALNQAADMIDEAYRRDQEKKRMEDSLNGI